MTAPGRSRLDGKRPSDQDAPDRADRRGEALQPFQTVADILDEVEAAHARCREHYAAAARAAGDQRVAGLLGFLAARDAEHLTAIARVRSSHDDALSCYVQNVPAKPLGVALRLPPAAADVERIVGGYVQRDLAFERTFTQLEASVGPRARAIFADLARMQRQNQARLREALLDF